ncbi:MAG: CBS domain-containing protein [Chloroflexi bacterium]|nr:CBS domain-containing protein [Chloroflexota bacterium]MDL1882081.1 CBS domain-containing protein [Anaerolineae bacterium CFX8]
MEFIVTHENADFDAIAAALAAHKLYPEAIPVLPERLNQNVARFVTLYQNGLPFVRQRDVRAGSARKLIVVDTQRPIQLRGQPPDTPTHMIDHHPLARDLQPHQTFKFEPVGATTTLLVEQIREQHIPLNPLEATLLALGIYEDTGSLVYGTTTPRDLRAATWLLEQQASLDTIRRFLFPPLNEIQQALFDSLVKAAESRSVEGHVVIVSAVEVDRYIAEISSVVHRLRDTLDPAALFVAVAMPGGIQLVCRSTVSALDVGEIARLFGGGGHHRAAAATINDKNLADTVALLWREIEARTKPTKRVADLMSYGVNTVSAGQRINEIIRPLRRIGHEGYPVLDGGQVVGLLTRRDMDRAIEHGLGNLTARDIMNAGTVTLRPDDSVTVFEQRLVESGWGQIPVIGDSGALIGIVTRTDLINHWAQTHPPAYPQDKIVSGSQIESVLGRAISTLINTIAALAQESGISLYLVGGIVRDLLLYRRNLDIDFVAEGDAIHLTEMLQKRLGGRISSFRPFGTAKWKLDEQVAAALHLDARLLPDHIDFATSRNEFYEHPTALPTVYNSSIKLDLQRRDFTINAMAVQLSPAAASGRVMDYYGGLHDLQARQIRVLHSLSFVDDPTRILRAVRFQQRLDFTIEPRTAELIAGALPMLGRITGERIRNELTLLLRETEPENGLLALQERGALAAIHPAFVLSSDVISALQRARAVQDWPWPMPELDMAVLYWHIIAAGVPLIRLPSLLERLLFGRGMTNSLLEAARLAQQADELAQPDLRPSQITAILKPASETACLAAWLLAENPLVGQRIRRYMVEWRFIQPGINGHHLQKLGLKPGPRYSAILNRLRQARLDGETLTDADENRLLQHLLEEKDGHDRA